MAAPTISTSTGRSESHGARLLKIAAAGRKARHLTASYNFLKHSGKIAVALAFYSHRAKLRMTQKSPNMEVLLRAEEKTPQPIPRAYPVVSSYILDDLGRMLDSFCARLTL